MYLGSEDCQASHCPPSQFTDCQWPMCALQLDRNVAQQADMPDSDDGNDLPKV